MGLVYAEGKVQGPNGEETINFLVDSGAKYSLLPEKVWKKLGIRAVRSMQFVLADGTLIERSIGECYIKLSEGEAHTPVILGEGSDEPLLGVVTLEILGFVIHPFSREIRPMKLVLATLK